MDGTTGEPLSVRQSRPHLATPLGSCPQAGVTALQAGGQPPAHSWRSQASGRDTSSRNPKTSLSEWGPESHRTWVRPGSRQRSWSAGHGADLGAEV